MSCGTVSMQAEIECATADYNAHLLLFRQRHLLKLSPHLGHHQELFELNPADETQRQYGANEIVVQKLAWEEEVPTRPTATKLAC